MSRRNWLLGAVLLGASLATVANDLSAVGVADASFSPPQHGVLSVGNAELSDPGALVDIPDAALRRALEKALGKEQDAPITRGDMAGLTGLTIDGCVDHLTGLEHAINLVGLVCENGGLADLTPLAGLESLTSLSLRVNAIYDITPLAGLRSLTRLQLRNNAISDIAPLASLELLTTLSLDYNGISDLRPLGRTSFDDVAIALWKHYFRRRPIGQRRVVDEFGPRI